MADESQFASEAELKKIEELRGVMASELGQLKAAGSDMDHSTGDIFFTRVLRGNDGDVKKSADWYRNCLRLRAEYGLDAIGKECLDKNQKCSVMQMPHAEEVLQYLTFWYEEDVRTTSGHVLSFDSAGDSRTTEILPDLGEEKVLKFFHTYIECRCIQLNRLSLEEGRIIKGVLVKDFEGVSFSQLDQNWRNFEKTKLFPVFTGVSIESYYLMFFTNMPTWVNGIFTVIKNTLPTRVTMRFRSMGANWSTHPELLAEVGLPLMKRCMDKRNMSRMPGADDGAMEGEGRVIAAGKTLERIIDVNAGDQVTWSFAIGTSKDDPSGASRGRLGKALDAVGGESTELQFQVKFMRELDPNEPDFDPANVTVMIVEPVSVDDGFEQLGGKTVVTEKGIMVVTWSNARSWVRSRTLQNFKVQANRLDDDVGSFKSGDD